MGVKEENAREAIQKIVPWWIGTMGLRFSRAKVLQEKRIRDDEEVVGRI
jgi:hypothetical protein